MMTSSDNWLQVAVGVIKNANNEVLVALRPQQSHQGGLWEFPGGKIEAQETVADALVRELQEELGIAVLATQPLITIRHHYEKLSVQLNVREVTDYKGLAQGMEGQAIQWIAVNALHSLDFPAANRPIIQAIKLPPYYAVLDFATVLAASADALDVVAQLKVLHHALAHLLSQGLQLIQVRAKSCASELLNAFMADAVSLAEAAGATLLLNSALSLPNYPSLGLHLTCQDLMAVRSRPNHIKCLAASCHNQAELEKAQALGVDFVVLSPIQTTLTHPEVEPMGWAKFAELVDACHLPVYAMGGLGRGDLVKVKNVGGQGVAGIRLFF